MIKAIIVWLIVASIGLVDGRFFSVSLAASTIAVVLILRLTGFLRWEYGSKPKLPHLNIEITPLRYDILDLARFPVFPGHLKKGLDRRCWDEVPRTVMDEITLLERANLLEPGPVAGQIVLTDRGRMLLGGD